VNDRERWDDRWRDRGEPGQPSLLVTALAPRLPARGRALDVAAGGGRHALWLASRGLDVTACDLSPIGLALCSAAARTAGLDVHTVEVDLEPGALPAGPWDVIVSFHFLWRPLWPALRAALAPGGLLLFVQPTVRNLERHQHPRRELLLAEGELRELATGLELLEYDEGWSAEDRHEARLLARRVLSPP